MSSREDGHETRTKRRVPLHGFVTRTRYGRNRGARGGTSRYDCINSTRRRIVNVMPDR